MHLHIDSALDISHFSSSSSSLTAVVHEAEGQEYFTHHIALFLDGCIPLQVRRQRNLVWKTTLAMTAAVQGGRSKSCAFKKWPTQLLFTVYFTYTS